ncbi:MAG: hypothetical protein IKZ26_01240 [Peptococcaceae bacterium]|nr:hypothetical protein [Peptococcaceae bacterium]
MYLAVNTEAMLMLGYAVSIGFLILFGVPACIGLWRFLKELVQQTKSAQGHLYEIMDDKRAEFFGTYLKDEIKRQNEISKIGAEAYRKEERSAMLKKYRIPMIAAVILLVLAVLLNQWVLQAALVLLEKGGVIKNFSFACLSSSVVLFLYYLCCKQCQRKKWKACFAIAIIGMVHGLGRLTGAPVPIPVEVVIPVFLALGAFHYSKWSKGLAEMTQILQHRLQEKRYAKEPVVNDYLELESLRKQNQYPAGSMKQDDEVDEMLIYLSWLEQSK